MSTSTEFPFIVQPALATSIRTLAGVEEAFCRPLWHTDANGSVGISALDWTPIDMEIGHFDPVVSRYNFRLEALVKHSSVEEGSAIGSVLAKSIRTMLYRDETLRIRLGGLQETLDGVVERVQRWGISKQRFSANGTGNTFLHLSTTDIWVETETS